MPHILNTNSTASRWAIGTTGVFAFAAGLSIALALVAPHDSIHRKCFVAYCPERKPDKQDIVKRSIVGFYLCAVIIGMIIFILKRNKAVNAVMRSRPVFFNKYVSPLSISEILVAGAIVGFSIWKCALWGMLHFSKPPRQHETRARYIARNLVHVSGSLLDICIGLVMIPAGKNTILTTHLKIPYETGIRFHKTLGIVMFYITVAHFIFFAAPVLSEGVKGLFKILFAIGRPSYSLPYLIIFMGNMAFIAFIIAIIPAHKVIRKRHFNTFYFMHAFMLVMIIFAILHSSTCLYFSLPGIFLWIADVCIRLYGRYLSSPQVVSVIREPLGYYLVTIDTPTKFKYFPGQYVFLCIPAVSKVEYHPFSLCGRPDSNSLQVLIQPMKRRKEWTTRAVKYLTSPSSDLSSFKITWEGPFGNWLCDISGQDYIICVCTGSGVAPIIGIARHAMEIPLERMPRIIILWSDRNENASKCLFVKELHGACNGNIVFNIFNTKKNFEVELTKSGSSYKEANIIDGVNQNSSGGGGSDNCRIGIPQDGNIVEQSNPSSSYFSGSLARGEYSVPDADDTTTLVNNNNNNNRNSYEMEVARARDEGRPVEGGDGRSPVVTMATESSPQVVPKVHIDGSGGGGNATAENESLGGIINKALSLVVGSRSDDAGMLGAKASPYDDFPAGDGTLEGDYGRKVSSVRLSDEENSSGSENGGVSKPGYKNVLVEDDSEVSDARVSSSWGGSSTVSNDTQVWGRKHHQEEDVNNDDSHLMLTTPKRAARKVHNSRHNDHGGDGDGDVSIVVDGGESTEAGLSPVRLVDVAPRSSLSRGIRSEDKKGSLAKTTTTAPSTMAVGTIDSREVQPQQRSSFDDDSSGNGNKIPTTRRDGYVMVSGVDSTDAVAINVEQDESIRLPVHSIRDDYGFQSVHGLSGALRDGRQPQRHSKPRIFKRRIDADVDLRRILTPILSVHKTAKIGMFLCTNDKLQNSVRVAVNSISQVYRDAEFDIHSESYGF